MNLQQSRWRRSRDDRILTGQGGTPGHRDGLDLEVVYRFRWNPTQVVVIVCGIFLMALGGIGLARAGAEGISGATSPEVVVGVWHRTPLMAVVEMSIGFLLVVSGAQRLLPRGLYRAAGSLAIVFGIVLISQPATFDSVLGASRNTGWLYAAVGLILLVLGFGAPIVFEREQVTALNGERDPSTSRAEAGVSAGQSEAGGSSGSGWESNAGHGGPVVQNTARSN